MLGDIISKKAIYVTFILLLSQQALAYIDPGTGGVIAGSVLNFIYVILLAIGGFIAAYMYRPVKRFILRMFKK